MSADDTNTVIELKNLTVGYRKGKKELPVLSDINVGLNKGQLTCLVGKNGIGKSTLLRSIAGVQPSLNGDILINNIPLLQISSPELARLVSLVLTDRIFAGNLSVEELVALGRFPYTNWLGSLSDSDIDKINWAIAMTGISNIKYKSINELSDGQFQKALIARALAQDGDIMILDEPTAHLDLINKIAVLKLLKDLSRQTNKSILMATHELEYTFQIADQMWVANERNNVISGCPEDLVLKSQIKELYDHESVIFEKDRGRFFVKNKFTKRCYLEGDKSLTYWTLNALNRNGWQITKEKEQIKIFASDADDKLMWKLEYGDSIESFYSIQALIFNLNKIEL